MSCRVEIDRAKKRTKQNHGTDTALNPSATMSGPKKRKVDSECRVFNKEWTSKYFFTEVQSKAVCLICQETVAAFKEYNINCHFSSKHANYANDQSLHE